MTCQAQSDLARFLRVRGLSKCYVRGGLWRKRTAVAAVDAVDLEIPAGKTLALRGRVGVGEIHGGALCGAPGETGLWPNLDQRERRRESKFQRFRFGESRQRELLFLRNRVQMVFQDAVTSMNPRFTAAQVVEEPLLIMGVGAQVRRQASRTVVSEVGLPADWLERSVMEFSGGQRQRLAIARALVVRPNLLVLDEALTGLDLSTQAQIANLLLDLQAAHSLTYLLISHDLALVARMADTDRRDGGRPDSGKQDRLAK